MSGFAEFAASIGLSELQLSLGLIGFSLLLVLMIYNALRIRKAEVEEASNNYEKNDYLDQPEIPDQKAGDFRSEPTMNSAPSSSPAIKSSAEKIDSLIDCIIALRFSQAISGQEILLALDSWPKNMSHIWLCEGLVSQELGAQAVWQAPQQEGSYIELQLAIQMANRSGPIGVVDLSDFASRAQVLANTLDAEIDLPPINEILEEAKAIDSFAAGCDIQLGINVQPKSDRWTLGQIRSAVAKAGFQLSRDGREYNRIVSGINIYKLIAEQSNFLRDDLSKPDISAVTFLLDLPKVAQDFEPFKVMLDDARLLAESLGGHLVDDAGRPLVDEAVVTIQTQLDQIYQSMSKHGIAAGSATASRLFS
jgi:hypothetical protein